jgi:NADH-ubiquinone oxidoreductase chain 6
MPLLYLLNEIITNNFNYNVLTIISILSILFGIFIIITNNPIISILFLIGLFITIASYLMVLGINFIGLSYLLVYVGAVSILFLFILMLINIRISELVINNTNSIPLAIMVGIFFNINMSKIFNYKYNIENHMNFFSNDEIYSTYYEVDNLVNNFHGLYKNELFFVTSQL